MNISKQKILISIDEKLKDYGLFHKEDLDIIEKFVSLYIRTKDKDIIKLVCSEILTN